MKRAFTLIELLIVIAIIAVLIGVLITFTDSGVESARAAKCLGNLKNLANASQSYGLASRHYPLAGSVLYLTIDESRGIRNAKKRYYEERGWISWLSQDMFPMDSASTPPTIGFLGSGDEEQNTFAITNGTLFRYVSGNRDTYVCPCHNAHGMRKAAGGKGQQQSMRSGGPLWSYLMNAYFKWNSSDGSAYLSGGVGHLYGSLDRADRILLFSEIPFRGVGEWRPTGQGNGMEDDAILQYRGCNKAPGLTGRGRRDGNEYIGGNHPIGSLKSPKGWVSHVAFADGHVEKIQVSNLGDEDLRKLTTYLCTGVDYEIQGTSVNELK